MLLHSQHVKIDHLKFTGKYSFQYMHDLEITNSYLDTKDAFWHSNNVIVKENGSLHVKDTGENQFQ